MPAGRPSGHPGHPADRRLVCNCEVLAILDEKSDLKLIRGRGAVLSQLPEEAAITSTVATKHYGVSANHHYDEIEDSGQPTKTNRYSGAIRVEKMTWYINRGEDMQRDQKIIFPFKRSLPHDYSPSKLIFSDDLLECSLDQPVKYPKKGVTSTNCRMTANLTSIGEQHFHRRTGLDGTPYVDVHYDLVISTKTAIMKFSLEVDGKEMGSIEANYEPNKPTSLSGDIWHIVCELLLSSSRPSLLALRLTSRSNKAYVDPVLYRHVELAYGKSQIESTSHVVKRLLDPDDSLISHVRKLEVCSLRDGPARHTRKQLQEASDDDIDVADLETIVGKLSYLQTFSWRIKRPMPGALIAKLERHWPGVKLLLSHENLEIDTKLLRSPLLRSLSFGILNTTVNGHHTRELYQCSKLPELREILLGCPNLKNLNITLDYHWARAHGPDWPGTTARPHLLHLPLQAQDRLPSLQELTFAGPPEPYEFTLEHCRLWSSCMDWAQLRRLDLGMNSPQPFFETFATKLPNLKSLAMGMRMGERRYSWWEPMTCGNLNPIINFLCAIPPLYELTLTDFESACELFEDEIWENNPSLQKLYYHVAVGRKNEKHAHAWELEWIVALGTLCPDITDLTIDFPLVDGHWPTEYAEAITKFDHLDTLKVFVELNGDASDFSEEYPTTRREGNALKFPRLKVGTASKTAEGFFKAFFIRNPYARLRSLEICFLRMIQFSHGRREPCERSIFVSRLERDDAPNPLEGGYQVVAPGPREGTAVTPGRWEECDVSTRRVV
ncbi:MAG: hypothetical protein Q9168_003816 [Polycauliona sp. 1 TL-2023]